MPIKAINPATGETIKEYDEMPAEEVKSAIEKSHAAFLIWRRLSFAERASLMKNVARILRDRVEDYARLITGEITGRHLKLETQLLIHSALKAAIKPSKNSFHFLLSEMMGRE